MKKRIFTPGSNYVPWMRKKDKKIFALIKNSSAFVFTLPPVTIILDLATATETYSGSDICTVVRDALLEPVREVTQTQTWLAVRDTDDVHTTGLLYPQCDLNLFPRSLELLLHKLLQ